jgi:hypothetical protein
MNFTVTEKTVVRRQRKNSGKFDEFFAALAALQFSEPGAGGKRLSLALEGSGYTKLETLRSALHNAAKAKGIVGIHALAVDQALEVWVGIPRKPRTPAVA